MEGFAAFALSWLPGLYLVWRMFSLVLLSENHYFAFAALVVLFCCCCFCSFCRFCCFCWLCCLYCCCSFYCFCCFYLFCCVCCYIIRKELATPILIVILMHILFSYLCSLSLSTKWKCCSKAHKALYHISRFNSGRNDDGTGMARGAVDIVRLGEVLRPPPTNLNPLSIA